MGTIAAILADIEAAFAIAPDVSKLVADLQSLLGQHGATTPQTDAALAAASDSTD